MLSSYKFISSRTLLLAAVMGIGTAVWAGNPEMEMTVKVGRGSGDDPMIVVWAETTDGDFVKTIHMFSKDKEYYKDMLAWRFKSNKKESKEQIDGVSGATIRWTKEKTVRFPVKSDGIDLLDGNYILRIESRQWKGKHFRNFGWRCGYPDRCKSAFPGQGDLPWRLILR